MSLSKTTKLHKKKAAFLNLGCKVNSYETEAMIQLLKEAGAEIVDFDDKADIYVVNTCTVTNIADRKSRQMLHKAKHRNLDSIVVAVGCYAQEAKDVLEKDDTVDIIIGNNHKKDIVRILEEYVSGNQTTNVDDIFLEQNYEELQVGSVSEKTRAYIKIQDGCNQFCSYCIIPYARGRIRSRNPEDVVNEVKQLVTKGYKEIVLTGIHLSSYGLQQGETELNGRHLAQLIHELGDIDGLQRIRLGSLEPRIMTEDFVRSIAEQEKLCPHFHLSLQSGCDETLKRMNRKYTTKEYLKACDLLRQYFTLPAITTDVIVGFPGETQEEFLTTVEFLKKVSFAQMHIFKFSKRKGTKAETMAGQVSDQIKSERSDILLTLEKELRLNYQQRFIGSYEEMLVEEFVSIEGNTYITGHNKRYIRLYTESEVERDNELITGKIVQFFNHEHMLLVR